MGTACRILLVSGSLRSGSTNTALLRTAAAVAPATIAATLYEEMAALPHFNPDDDREGGPVDPAVARLRDRIGRADAVLLAAPEYAGALPGPFVNLLDWTVGGGETYGKPVGLVNASSSPTGAVDAERSLRTILERTGVDLVPAACIRLPVARRDVGTDGLIGSAGIRAALAAVLEALRTHAAARP